MFGIFKRKTPNRNRQIFRFWDGAQWRQCDPVETLIKLQAHPRYDYRIHPQMVDDGDQEAIGVTCDAVRSAFAVAPFDAARGNGLTIGETLALLAEFCVYLDDLKKSTDLPVTLPSLTGSTSSGSGEQTTSDMSAIGSTGTEPNCDIPTEFAAP